MKPLNKLTMIALAASVALLAGCSSDDDNAAPVLETGFNFGTETPDAFTRVDRVGMPAISTALIASKDGFNQANPTNDIAGDFVPEILTRLDFFHSALDGQLQGLNLTPCTVVGDGTGTCAAFAVPLIIPDTLKINTNQPSGFPNGRNLSAPVIDVTLAVALLELTGDTPPHTPTDLVGVLNPAGNDKELSTTFPYLASPH